MPMDFRLIASEKYKKELEESAEDSDSKQEKRNKKKFALESNFSITDMLNSGRVIYGDPLSIYVNKIADELLKHDPELRKELRFYIIKSTVSNAYSTNQGIIFVTSGLIAQVENEAQLAFIIAHEIVHYTQKHNYEQFKKKETVLRRAGRTTSLGIEQKLKSLYKYSKEHETEADSKGLELFMKSAYNPYAALSSMDVLLYSYLPFDVIEWKPVDFETEYYKFPEKYLSKKLDPISANEDENDSKSTHPNMLKRKNSLMNRLKADGGDTSNKKWNLISETEFKNARKIARYESASLYLKSGNPVMAYYIAYLLDKTYGSTYYSDLIKSMSFYSLSHHESFGDYLSDYGVETSDYEGEIQQVPFFLTKLRKKELCIFAAKYLSEMCIKYPQDKKIQRMRNQIFSNLINVEEVSKFHFTNFSPIQDTATETNTGTKVERLKSKQRKQRNENKYYYSAFYELLKDSSFRNYFASLEGKDSDDENDEDDDYDEDRYKKELAESRGFKSNSKKNKPIEKINSIILFKPDYNSSVLNRTNLLGDETKQIKLMDHYRTVSKKFDVKIDFLEDAGGEEYNTEMFNRNAQIKDWMFERFNNDTLTMELFQKEKMAEAITNYDARHLAWSGFKYTEKRKNFVFGNLINSVVIYPLFPFYIWWQVSNIKETENLMLIYDTESSKAVYIKYIHVTKPATTANLKALIYNQVSDLSDAKK